MRENRNKDGYRGRRTPTEAKQWDYVTGLYHSKDNTVLLGKDDRDGVRYLVAKNPKWDGDKNSTIPAFKLKRSFIPKASKPKSKAIDLDLEDEDY